KEIKLTECVKVKITDRKGKGPLTDMQILPFYRSALKNDAHDHAYFDYFISDMYGRSIYLAYSKALTDNSGEDYRRAILMLFTPHCPYSNDWIELFDFFNYQEDLKQFMESNNWNQPYE
ncbi:MAG: hypothetical protein LBC96_09310, partial [Lachnospiraceae bacterium]|nr:hypothetical protein [Lachnospiraceae bacterium]